MAGEGLPSWVTWVQALAPTSIALIALIVTAWIQIGQSRTAKNKLKVDLFELRYELLESVRRIVAIGLGSKTGDKEYFSKLEPEYQSFRKQKLLFPREIGDLIEEVVTACDELWVADDLPGSHPEMNNERQRKRELRQKIRENMKILNSKIEEFVRVDWNG